MTKLEDFLLKETDVGRYGCKVLCDLLKSHMKNNRPDRMYVNFDSVDVGKHSAEFFHVHADLTNPQQWLLDYDEERVDPLRDFDTMLIRYMLGLTGWNNDSTWELLQLREEDVPYQD